MSKLLTFSIFIQFSIVYSIRYGQVIPKDSFPFITRIEVFNQSILIDICAGSLISGDIVYTAGHCLRYWPSSTIVMVINENDSGRNEYMEYRRTVTSVFIPNGYNQSINWYTNAKFDYGLAFLDTAVPICGHGLPYSPLFEPTVHNDLKGCTVMGWGQTEDSYFHPSKSFLKGTRVERFNLDESSKTIRVEEYSGNGMACSGDSGAPLICSTNGRPTLIGLLVGGSSTVKGKAPKLVASQSFNMSSVVSTFVAGYVQIQLTASGLSTIQVQKCLNCYMNAFGRISDHYGIILREIEKRGKLFDFTIGQQCSSGPQ